MSAREIIFLVASYVERADQEAALERELSAREERGRRAGIEEAAKNAETYCPPNASAYSHALAAQIAAHIRGRALAPRCTCPSGVWSGHVGGCALAPRDSGKEG